MALEWSQVEETVFVNPAGIETRIKLIHEFDPDPPFREIDFNNRDIDEAAFDELGSEHQSLRLMEANMRELVEFDFDLSRLKTINVPI